MKTLALTLSILLLAVTAHADTWHTANQITFAWDAVPKIAESDVMSYQPYLKDKSGLMTKAGAEVAATQVVVTIPAEGRYRLCAQTVRYVAGETEPELSEVSCSDVAEVCQDGNTFGVRYFIKPNRPGNLR